MTETVAAGQLRALIERIERVEEEIRALNADKSEIYKEARGVGFDVKAIRQCVAARKLDSAEREERNAIFDLYWEALTGASRVHVHKEPSGETSMVPVTGKERPLLRPEAASTEARFETASLHQSEPHPSPNLPSQSTDESPAPRPNPAPGNLSPDRATPGEDGPPSKPSPEDARAKNDDAPSGAIGQRHVGGNSGQAEPIEDDAVPAFLLKDRPPLRPLCLNPSECAGYGRHTCHRCLAAAGQSEAAA